MTELLSLCDALKTNQTQAEVTSTELLFKFGTPVSMVMLNGWGN